MPINITDLYNSLFGKKGIADGNVIDMAEHGRVGGLSTGQSFKHVSVIDPSTGESTTDLQNTLNALTETLQELISRLEPLAGAMANTAQLRVVQTTVPSTAVTGPITSAQSIAEKAVAGISFPEKVAVTNQTAIQSNINNCTGA